MYTVILAGSFQEAMTYAVDQGLRNTNTRGVAGPNSVPTVIDQTIELPSYDRRPDKHAIEARLRDAGRRRPFIRMLDEDWVHPKDRPPPDPVEGGDPDKLITINEVGDLDLSALVESVREENPELADAIEKLNEPEITSAEQVDEELEENRKRQERRAAQATVPSVDAFFKGIN